MRSSAAVRLDLTEELYLTNERRSKLHWEHRISDNPTHLPTECSLASETEALGLAELNPNSGLQARTCKDIQKFLDIETRFTYDRSARNSMLCSGWQIPKETGS